MYHEIVSLTGFKILKYIYMTVLTFSIEEKNSNLFISFETHRIGVGGRKGRGLNQQN